MAYDIPRQELQDRKSAFLVINACLPADDQAKNLDSLHDILTQLPSLTLRLVGPAPEGIFYPLILRVLRDAQQENPGFTLLEMPEEA